MVSKRPLPRTIISSRITQLQSRSILKIFYSILVLSQITISNALNAYMYYEDAHCTGDNYISGTLMYDYGEDAAVYNVKGFTFEDYDGPCYHFASGAYDFSYGEPENGMYMSQGYCIKCNGVIGCSTEYNSCHEFMSIQPTYSDDDGAYQDDDGDDDYTRQYNGYAKNQADAARKVIKQRVKDSNSKRPYSYVMIGAISMLVLLSILTGSLSAVKKLREASGMDFCKDKSRCFDPVTDELMDDDDNSLAPAFIIT